MPSRQRQECRYGYQGRKQSLRQDACPWFTIAYPKLAICPNQRRPFSVPVSKDGRIERFLTDNEAQNSEGVVIHKDGDHRSEDAERHPCVFVDQPLIRETHREPTGSMTQKACERDVGGSHTEGLSTKLEPSMSRKLM